jgi:hypothetical protein
MLRARRTPRRHAEGRGGSSIDMQQSQTGRLESQGSFTYWPASAWAIQQSQVGIWKLCRRLGYLALSHVELPWMASASQQRQQTPPLPHALYHAAGWSCQNGEWQLPSALCEASIPEPQEARPRRRRCHYLSMRGRLPFRT